MTEEKVADTNGQENEDNEKETDSVEEEGELESAIIRQVEYYFGDLNLPRDKFLREQVKLDDGWVPLDVLIRFNRLAKLSKDTKVIAEALKKSSSDLLEISDDNKKVRRNPEMMVPEFNEERRKELSSRTIYAKGFPKDSNLDDLLKFFKQYEVVENVVMRRYLDRQKKERLFKGSVFVTFKTKEQAEKFIELKDIKYNDAPLLILWQENYFQQKQEEYASKKEKRDKKNKAREGREEKKDKEEFKLPTGTVVKFSECDDKISREDVKTAILAVDGDHEVAYIDFKVGDAQGFVRFAKEDTAKTFSEKLTDGKLKIGETDVVFKVLEGEEEKTYLDNTIEEMSKRRRSMKNNKYKGKQNFKGKHGRKRKQDDSDEAPASKVKAN